jgi:hypothetical protein
MGDSSLGPVDATPNSSEDALIAALSGGRGRKYVRLAVAALGSIPWVGGLIAASASLSAETDAEHLNDLQRLWIQEHQDKVRELATSIGEIADRLEEFGQEVQQRIDSPEYLSLVRRTFRSWDDADTKQKREMLQRLITNAGASTLCPDDLVRLFIGWMDLYHEAHFMVIRQLFNTSGLTRADIWDRIHPSGRPRDDSSEADLFRYLIRDLSTGGVIRQERDTDGAGRFLRKPASRTRTSSPAPRTMESAFEETKPYELTELGKQFVHYVMTDVVPQIGAQ